MGLSRLAVRHATDSQVYSTGTRSFPETVTTSHASVTGTLLRENWPDTGSDVVTVTLERFTGSQWVKLARATAKGGFVHGQTADALVLGNVRPDPQDGPVRVTVTTATELRTMATVSGS